MANQFQKFDASSQRPNIIRPFHPGAKQVEMDLVTILIAVFRLQKLRSIFHQDQGCQVSVGEIDIKYYFLCAVEVFGVDR